MLVLATFLAGALYRESRKIMRILMTLLGKSTEIHHNSGVSAFYAKSDWFLWIFPGNVIRIRMILRDSLYNAPARKVSNCCVRRVFLEGPPCPSFPWCFSVSLMFFFLWISLLFWGVFCLFHRDSKGSQGQSNPWCFGGLSLVFQKTKEKKDRAFNYP